jgi:hypothetical protein
MNEQQNIDINVKMIQMVNQLQRLFPNHQVQICKGYGIRPDERTVNEYYYGYIEGFWFSPGHTDDNNPIQSQKSFTLQFSTLQELDEFLFKNINTYKNVI